MPPRRLLRLPPLLLALIASSFAHAADDETAAQRQLREDRERFQREIERQRTEAQIQTDRARQSAEQQRTADELARLRAQQDRQSSQLYTLNLNAPDSSSSTRLRTDPRPPIITPTPASAMIAPDFAITLLPDGRCVLHLKGRPPEIKSPSEAQTALQQLLTASKPANHSP